MGPGEAVLLGFVLLFSCGNLGVASCSRLSVSTNKTHSMSQIPQVAASSLQTMDHRPNRTGSEPLTYRLRSYQLRKQKPAGPLMAQTQAPEQQKAPELFKLPFKGPDLNPRPKQESKVPKKAEQRVPVAAESVAVRCGEREVSVEVKKNFLGNGQVIRASDLTLGGCAGVDTDDHVLWFHAELQGCGSTLKMTEGALVYSFSLIYSPTPIGDTFTLKTSPAEVGIDCHYLRRHYVSSNAMRPAWTQFASDVLAEQRHHFSLRLMTADWQSQRPSSGFFLSDVMHIEAAVLQGHHAPLRVFVDSCVATAEPDPSSKPSYPFISNHGCLTDAKLTGAKSYFMQRSREDKLHFLLKAFRFKQNHNGSLYITCHLKATTVSVPVDSQHKACSFLTEANRWVASGGDNKVCGCCESSCGEERRRRGLVADAGLPPELQWEAVVALGPILLEETVLEEELTEVSELPPEMLHTQEVTPAASSPSIALLCGLGAALAVVLIFFMGAVTVSKLHKLNGYDVST
ncbi:zona pellucida sperm-binding protein 3-like [Hippoglossus hippoglossus]|uniref:zona pellucida sperm-binding protein 3-like n=1 Tax=Hippoglossus hippoglossus TaxID=8267 RepID=UPI00148B3B8C|nr:zona pellucida sperm-binding protein 3-like [Hippoglossus hippoglossus]